MMNSEVNDEILLYPIDLHPQGPCNNVRHHLQNICLNLRIQHVPGCDLLGPKY